MDIPPELLDWLNDWPFGLLAFFLATPLLVLVGVSINAFVTRKGSKESRAISEKEAETHQFSAILDGLQELLNRQKQELSELRARVEVLETHEHDLIGHVYLLESMIPIPPGPPGRPSWMQTRTIG